MPVHDWTRVDAGLFHAFHQRWITALRDALNSGRLGPDVFALAQPSANSPQVESLIQNAESGVYARKADRVVVRHRHGEVVAVIEVVSPGNKGSASEFRAFVGKTADLIQQGVHVLVIDLFPPGRRDPQGLHKAIWDEFQDEEFTPPPGKPLTLASYSSGALKTAYVESIAVGDELPAMPLFLEAEVYVPVPLEATYGTSWAVFPAALKGLLEG